MGLLAEQKEELRPQDGRGLGTGWLWGPRGAINRSTRDHRSNILSLLQDRNSPGRKAPLGSCTHLLARAGPGTKITDKEPGNSARKSRCYCQKWRKRQDTRLHLLATLQLLGIEPGSANCCCLFVLIKFDWNTDTPAWSYVLSVAPSAIQSGQVAAERV